MAVDSKTLQIIIKAKDATGPAFSSAQKAAADMGGVETADLQGIG